ncbi:MAG TPA: hypothetical protein VJH95_01480 [Candidatus Nanoarchaeia archaeon]|nr:hypothetical protein [Candidatus Nanoarchaeia archaeon]
MAVKHPEKYDPWVESMLKKANEKSELPKPQSLHENIDVEKIERLAESLKAGPRVPSKKR